VTGRAAATAAYDPAYFADLARVEDRHFWFRARNRLIGALVRRAVAGLPTGYRVLEVGCGNGNVLRHMAQACPGGLAVGMDYFEEGLRLARRRAACPLVQGDARRSPFGRRFHVIGMFDVLEHIDDDMRMLRDVRALLEPGGVLLLTVPAGRRLWSYFDEASHHYRRYEHPELTEKLRAAGFEVRRQSHFMCSIYPLLRMARKRSGRSREESHELARREFRIVPVINDALSAVLSLEASWVGRGHGLPFGTSLVAVAHRPAGDE
jgi:SAM-dependent methyltransferase